MSLLLSMIRIPLHPLSIARRESVKTVRGVIISTVPGQKLSVSAMKKLQSKQL